MEAKHKFLPQRVFRILVLVRWKALLYGQIAVEQQDCLDMHVSIYCGHCNARVEQWELMVPTFYYTLLDSHYPQEGADLEIIEK